MQFQLLPVASATPNGDVFVADEYIVGVRIDDDDEQGFYYSTPWGCCDDPMCGIEHVEDRWRSDVIARSTARLERERVRGGDLDDRHPLEVGLLGGLRRSARLNQRYMRRDNRSAGYLRRSCRARCY